MQVKYDYLRAVLQLMLLHSHKLMFVHTDDLTLTSNSDKINGALEEKLFVEKIFLLLNRIFFCV